MARKAARLPSPLDSLLSYQRRWIDDAARFKIGCMARQTGKSWTSALEAVRDCLERKTTWVCLSAGERQALEWMLKAREHTEAFKVALAGYEEDRASAESLLKAAEIRWPNGSRLIAIPANPDTARGYSANLLLDEFAFHENPDAIWRAIYPSISNPLKGEFKIRVLHCFWTFASIEEAQDFLAESFGERGTADGAALRRRRLSWNVAVYHRARGGAASDQAPG